MSLPLKRDDDASIFSGQRAAVGPFTSHARKHAKRPPNDHRELIPKREDLQMEYRA
jgi:hypothetical protein